MAGRLVVSVTCHHLDFTDVRGQFSGSCKALRGGKEGLLAVLCGLCGVKGVMLVRGQAHLSSTWSIPHPNCTLHSRSDGGGNPEVPRPSANPGTVVLQKLAMVTAEEGLPQTTLGTWCSLQQAGSGHDVQC